MLRGKRFQNLKDQKIVSVTDDNGVWVTLDDSTNIKTDVFLQKYTEYFEADTFFSNDPVMENLAKQFSEKININETPVVGPGGMEMSGANNPAGFYVEETPEEIERKKRDLLSNFQQSYTPPPIENVIDENMIGNPNYQRPQPMQKRERPQYVPPPQSDTIVKDSSTGQVIMEPNVQQASYSEQQPTPSGDDIYKTYEQINHNTQPQEPIQKPVQPQQPQQPVQPPQQSVQPSQQGLTPEQEAFMFFKKFKKIHPVDIKINFTEMIADPVYVRQTAMNFEGDIIKFYTQELMNKLWNNPQLLEQQIYDQFEILIMGEKKVKPPQEKPKQKKPVKKEESKKEESKKEEPKKEEPKKEEPKKEEPKKEEPDVDVIIPTVVKNEDKE